MAIGITATGAPAGLQIGLAFTALWLGFRHGIDWDHIAALTDITGSQETRRRSMLLATLYAVGHAVVVFGVGVLAIAASAEVPPWLDATMSRVVGITLVALGIYVVVSLTRQGRAFRMRSRWMLLFAGVRRVMRWTARFGRHATDVVVITHQHDHAHDELHAHDHAHALVLTGGSHPSTHRHVHHHVATVPDDPFPTYGRCTALTVGALHGIGAETPTQILVFLTATRSGGTGVGIALLLCFVAGLLASNTVVALTAAFGFIGASRNFPLYVTVSVLAAAFSLVVGTLFLLGHDPLLPALAGG